MLNKLLKKKDLDTMLDESRNVGGLRRTLTATNLVTLGIGAIVGTGIFVITGQAVAMYAGPVLSISFLISAFGCVLTGLCYAYLGFDALLTAARGARNPQKDMPKGILFSLLICAVLYVSVTTVLTGIFAGLFPLHVLSELVSIGTLMVFTIVCIAIVILRKTQPELKRLFRTPLVPFISLLGAVVCILQMVSLPWTTWARLIIWTLIGVIIYFTYGVKHSYLNRIGIF